jgi:hypothetical protein
MTSRINRRRGLLIASAMGLVASTLTVAAAGAAAPDESIGTGASLGGGGTAPVIECAWALDDTDANWNSSPQMTYGALDDNPSVGGGFPCVADGVAATQIDGAQNTIQVLPNADDNPTEKWVELWAAVRSTASATTVYFDVYHPDGSFKVQIDGTKYADSSVPERCLGPAGMFDKAQGDQLITQQARQNIVLECQNQQKGLYYGAFGISKHQPYGSYRIEAHAATGGGEVVVLTYYITVLPFYQLEKDFTNVNFGPITANSHWWQPTPGDFVWDGVDNAANQKTTVRNTGNAGIGLSVRFSSMCLASAPDGPTGCTDAKRIDRFDAKFGARQVSNMLAIGNVSYDSALTSNLQSSAKPAPPGPWYSFGDDLARVLCPNDTGKIEFSVWTKAALPGGSYSAPNGIGLLARPLGLCPTDRGAPYLANGYTGDTPSSNTHHDGQPD